MSPQYKAQIQRQLTAVAEQRAKQQPAIKPKPAKPAPNAKPGRRAA